MTSILRTKRFLAFLTAILLLTTVLTGCHGSKKRAAFNIPETLDGSREFTLTFWAKNDTNLTQRAIYEKAMADFEALYPNVHIKMKLYNDYGRIYSDVITNIQTNSTPNVCITYPDHIATYLTGDNIVVPLDGLMADERYGLGGSELRFDSPKASEVVEQFLKEGKLAGSQYALPFMRSTEACYVNVDFLHALGYEVPEVLTWDFVWEVSEAALAKEADGETYKLNGQRVLIPFIYKSADNMMIQRLRQLDAGYSTEGGRIEVFNDVTRSLLFEVAEHVKSGAFSIFKISGYPGNYLNAGQCIFAVDSTAGATWMGSDSPLKDIDEEAVVAFETAVLPVPQEDPAHPVMISQGPSVCVFNKEDPQEVLYAWLFAQFLLTDEVQIAYSQTEGYIPVTLKAQRSAEYQDYLSRAGEDNELYYDVKLDAAKLLLDHVGDTFVTPVFNGSASLRDAAGSMIESVAKSVRRKETVDDAYMDALFEQMTGQYHLDQWSGTGTGRAFFGPLPAASIALLAVLGTIWVFFGLYAIFMAVKKRKLDRNSH